MQLPCTADPPTLLLPPPYSWKFVSPPQPCALSRTGDCSARRRPPGRVCSHPRGFSARYTGRSSDDRTTAVLVGRRRLLPHAAPAPPASGRRGRHGSYRPVRPARLRGQPLLSCSGKMVRAPRGGSGPAHNTPAGGDGGKYGRCSGRERLWGGLCAQCP